ncbi:PA14 domain-containing protein [Anatilimnocola floriformis]|uniref:PA14 domain-containing protein n=1 Tax=Anatilimnocola floriformis TaxID=2948575 RepID=UPI0020C5AE1E|nr:PA14 domain-containing protein [Anatilimnocola floriformis]
MRISLRDRLALSSKKSVQQSQKANRDRRRRVFFESLEERNLMAADAINDAGTTNENTILTTVSPATTSLLTNDTGTNLTVVAFTSTSVQGAAVSVAPGGTFSYNPTTSTSLQALGNSQNQSDTFAYAVSEGPVTEGFLVKTYLQGTGNLGAVDSFLAGNPAPMNTATRPVVNFFQTDVGQSHFIGAGGASPLDDETTVPGLPAGDQDNYVVEATTSIWIPAAGRYTFAVNSDDGFGLSITGANLLNTFGALDGASTLGVSGRQIFFNGRGATDTFGVWDFPTAGLYPLRLVNWEGGGGSSVEMFAARGDFTTAGTFAAAQTAGAQWRLVGDTFDANGIRAISPATSTDSAIVNINVTGVNGAPVANPDTYATNEDTAISVPVLLEVPGMNVAVYNQQGAETGYGTMAGADAVRNTVGRLPNQTGTVLQADFLGNGGSPHFAGGSTFAGTGGDNYAVYLTGTLRVATSGTYTFGVNSDDNSRIRINMGAGLTTVAQHTGCCSDQFGTPVSLAAGDYPFEAMYTEGGGGDYGEFFYAPGSFAAFDPAFKLLGDSSGGISSFSSITRPGVLGNDTDEEASNGNATQSLTVTQVSGTGGLTGFSSMGAKVTMNANGSFSYDPNQPGSAVQGLAAGQVAVDTFTYTVSDNAPGGALTTTGTASVTVTGRNDLPTTKTDSYVTDENTKLNLTDYDKASPRNNIGDLTPATTDDGVLVNDTDVDVNDTLQVYTANGAKLSGNVGTLGDGFTTFTTAKGATVKINDDGTFSYDPTTSKTLQALSTGDSTTDTFNYTVTDGSLAPGLTVKVYQPSGAGDLAGTDAFLAGARPNEKFNGPRSTVNFLNTGAAGQFNGAGTASPMDDETNVPGLGAGDQDNFVIEVTGKIFIPSAGDYTFSVNSDDGFGLTFSGGPGTVNLTTVAGDNDGTSTTGTAAPRLRRSTGRGSVDTFGVFNFSAPGYYDLNLVNWEGNGGANLEFYGAPGAFTSFAATNTWHLVGDTDNGGLATTQTAPNEISGTVNFTINGVNTAPVANTDTYTTNEDTALNIPVITPVPGMNVAVFQGTNAGIASIDAARTGVPSNTGTVLVADFIGNGGSPHFVGGSAFPGTGGDNYGVLITGTLRVNTAGTYTFGVNSDDASRIRIDLNKNGTIATDGTEDVAFLPNCCTDNIGAPVTLAVGDYPFEAMYTEGGGGDYGEFFYAPGSKTAFDSSFKLIGDASGGIASISAFVPTGLLGNDTDEEIANGNAAQNLTVTQLNGGGLTGFSTLGAKVTLNADGSFTYDPNQAGSKVQALQNGQVATDTFTYTVTDNAATNKLSTVGNVNITVTGKNDLTIVQNNSYATNEDTNIVTTDRDVLVPRDNIGDLTPANTADDGVLVNDTDIDNLDVLEVRTLQGNLLSGTIGTLGNGSATALTTLGASITMNDDGTFTYNPSGSSKLQNLGAGQTLIDSFTYTATDNQLVFDPNLNVQVYNQQSGETINGGEANADLVRGSRAPNYSGTIQQADVIGQPGGNFAVNNTLPGTANNTENYAVFINGVLRVTVAGVYTFGIQSDDFSRIRIDLNGNGNPLDDPSIVTSGCCANSFGQVTLAVGDYPFEAMYTEGGGGDYGEFFYAPGSKTAFDSSFKLIGDQTGTILGGRMAITDFPATVNITVTGVNDAPVAVNDPGYAVNPYVTSENSSLVVTANLVPGVNVFVYNQQAGEGYGTFAGADAVRGTRAPNYTGTIAQADIIGQPGGHFNVDNTLPGIANNTEQYAVYVTGILRVTTGGVYTFGTFSDDNSRIRIDLNHNGDPNDDANVVTQGGCCGDVFGQATLAPGDYKFEAMYTEGGGGDYGEFFYAPGTKTAFDSSFKLIGDASGGIASYSSINGLMTNDSDRDIGDTISVDTATIISTNGATITPLANGSFTYNPATSQAAQVLKDGQTLVDTFNYILRDSQGGTSTATVTVTVTGVSDPAFDRYTATEDINLTVPAGTGVLANDALPGNPAFEVVRANNTNLSGVIGTSGDGTATITTTAGGQVVINDNGSFTYNQQGVFNSLPVGQTAQDTFTYVVGGATAPGVLTNQSGASAFTVLDNDLLTGITPVITGNTLQGQEGTSSNPATLTNGTYGPAGAAGNLATFASQAVSISNGTTLTYNLDTATYPLGYDISSIAVYAGWQDNGRDNQDYTVQYSLVGSPGTFTDFIPTVSFAPGNPPNGQTAINSPTGFLQTGVAAIRFVFGNQENGYVGYRELDVTGNPRMTTTVNITVNGVNDAPTAEANGPYSIGAGQSLNVSAVGSGDVDTGTVLSYRWDLDNDGITDFTTASQTATIPWSVLQGVATPLGPGAHTIRLVVSDGLLTATDTAILNISDTFTYSPVQDGVADGYLLILNAAQTTIEIRDIATNALLSSVPKAGTNGVAFVGTTDNDTLIIDYANTTPIPALNGVSFNSGGGTDTFSVRNGTATNVTQTYTTDLDGSMNIDGRIVNYTGNESITDLLTAATRVFTYNGAAETIALANLVAGTSLQIDSSIGANTNFNKPTDALVVNLSTGSADTLNIGAATLTGNFTVNGSDGNDAVNFNGAVAVTAGATLPGLVTISGGNMAFANTGSITTPNNVVLTSGGAISTAGTNVDVSAATLTASAVTGIDLDTTVATLNGTTSGAGAIRFDETNAVTVQNVVAANGAVTITTATAGDVTVENLSSGTAATNITVNNGNLVSGAADAGVADIVAGTLTISLSTGAHTIGTSAANRLEINAVQLQANIAGGTNNSAWILDTAGGLQMNDSSMGATGTTVFDLRVLNGSLTSVAGGNADVRAIQVILEVTGATSTIGTSEALPLEINAATLAATAILNVLTPGAVTNPVYIRDVSDDLPIGTISAGLADVFLTSTAGSIIDTANDAVLDITAGRLVLATTAAGGGIGVTNGDLELQVGALEATAGTGGIFLNNTGNVTIGGISTAVGMSATGGDIVLTGTGSIAVTENITATGAGTDVFLTTTDAASAGQDITSIAGATISSAAGLILINAGDNGVFNGDLSSSSTVTINVDVGPAATDAAGAAATAGGVTTAPGGAFLNGNVNNDTFTVKPSSTAAFTVNGNLPTTFPGDTLSLDLTGTTNPVLTIGSPGSGSWSFGAPNRPVTYTSIENVNVVGATLYDLVLDANTSSFGNTNVDDLISIRKSGTTLIVERTGSNAVPDDDDVGLIFQGDMASILSFTYIGSNDNDTVTVSDSGGMLDFQGSVPGVPNNPNIPGAADFFFDGRAGSDKLVYNLTGANAAFTYAIGDGSGTPMASGEVQSTSGASGTLLTYFANTELVQSVAAGNATLLGDANANLMSIAPFGNNTRATVAGFTPLELTGNNVGAGIGVSGAAGADTLELIGIGSNQSNPLAITLSGDADADIIRVHSTSGNTGTVTLIGGTGNDQFQLYNVLNTVDSIAGQVVVDGTDGNIAANNDTLTIIDSGDTTADNVLISAVNPATSGDYQIDGINSVAGSDVVFRNVDTLVYTATQGNDTIDTQLTRTTPVSDLSFVTVNGWLGADQFLLFTSDQAGGTGPTPTGMSSGVAIVNLNGDAPGNPNGADGNDVFGQTGPGIIGTGASNTGLTVADSVRGIRPSTSTAININGGQPTGPAVPTGDTVGDVLNLDLSGLPGSSAIILPTVSGIVGATGLQPLSYAQIEDLNLIVNNQLINVQMGDTFVRGTAGSDTIIFSKNVTTGSDPNAVRVRVNNLVVDLILSGKTLTYAGASNDFVNQANVDRPAEIYGEAGDDYISGAGANDFLVGGTGADQINGGGGDNVIWGDNSPTLPGDPNPQDGAIGGNDILSGLDGNDVFYGGAGDDQISAGGGNDYVSGGQGNDIIAGAAGDDRLYGGAGNDVLGGGEGNDLLSGGEGNDQLLGNSGNDVLIGGGGADQIDAGSGNDLIIGGRVANENSSFTSVASTSTFGAATYSNPTDNDAALLTLLTQWAATKDLSSLGIITHDGATDRLIGSVGDDTFNWESIDLAGSSNLVAPSDFNAFGMGTDVRIGPNS